MKTPAQSQAPKSGPYSKIDSQIYLVRHGETSMNDPEDERYRGWSNPPLNETGIADAHAAGRFLADKGIQHIISSDLGRTMDTANIISQYTHAEVVPVHDMRTWNVGQFTGMRVSDAKPQVEAFKNSGHAIPGGESYPAFQARWRGAIQKLVGHSKSSGAPVAVVTHSANIQDLGAKEPPPGGVVRMDIHKGQATFKSLNLKEGLPDDGERADS